jgi:translation initiation factor 1
MPPVDRQRSRMAKRREPPPGAASAAWPSLADVLRERGLQVREQIVTAQPQPAGQAVGDGAPQLSGGSKIVVRRERKGHGGKTVTVVEGLKVSSAQLETVARLLRRALGCGSWTADGRVLLQGDRVTGAEAWLRAHGAARVIVGN